MFWNRVLYGAISPSEGSTPPSLIAQVQFGATPAIVVASEILDVPVTITILRSGNLAPACSVTWTVSGTMTAADYVIGQPLTGTVSFGVGVNAALITLTIRPAVAGTPDKLIVITLSNPVDCEISGTTSEPIHVDMPGLAPPSDEYPTPLRTLRVTNRTELVAALTQTTGTFPTSIVIAGSNRNAPLRGLDRVICADGDYTGDYTPTTTISTTAGPIIIESESLHGARFLGRLTLNRENLWAAGLDFDGEGLETSAGLTMTSRFCRAHRCRFRRVESSSTGDGRVIVNVAAADCEVYYCLWDDNDARLLSGTAEGLARLHMYRCYLRNSRPESNVTREIVQIGQTHAGGDGLAGSLSPVHTVSSALLEFCLFENLLQLSGDEGEVVSIKSSGNTVRQCTFVDSQYLYVRFGNDNRLESNWFEAAAGTRNRGIGVRGDRNVIIGNKLGTGTRIRVFAGNQDMTCARWDKTTAGNFGTPRYMNPRTTTPTWGVAYSRPWSTATTFDAAGAVSSTGTIDPDLCIARDNWLVANDGELEVGHDAFDIHNSWRCRTSKIRAHVGAIKTENAYPSWANVPTATTGFFETLSDYSTTIDPQFLPLPTAALRLTPGEVGPGAEWIPPPGTIVPPPPPLWWKLPIRSGLPWPHGISFWSGQATTPTTPTGWPYPQSPLYTPLNFNGALTRYANGGDQWPVSEDSGGGLMFAAADDFGWAGPGLSGSQTKTSTRLIRVLGTPPGSLTGTNLDGRLATDVNIKPQAVMCFGTSNVALFYCYISPEPDSLRGRTFVGMSTNSGADVTWNGDSGDEIFLEGSGEDLMVWGCLHLAAGNTAGTSGINDDYVYVYLSNVRQLQISKALGGYAAGNGNKTIWLARCKVKGTGGLPANLLDRGKYSLFQGMSGGAPTWGADGGTTGKVAVFADPNGMAHGFNVFWHAAISKFVACYIHAGIGSGTQGIAVAISDSPWNPSGWTMIGYGEDLDNAASDETDWYLSVQAPGRWNNGTTMHFGVNTYVEGANGGSGDNLIVTPVALTAVVGAGTSAADFAAEEADLALIDASAGSSAGDAGGDRTNVATWDGVIGGAIGSAMDTSDTQFDWTSSDLRYAFNNVITNMPSGGGWLIWSVILIPQTLSTAVEADSAAWDQIAAGDHDLKYKKFGERVVRRMALTAHSLNRLIIDANPGMNLSSHYRVFSSTRTKYKNAMTRAINMIRQGADEYQAGSGDEFHFLHRPNYRGDIGSLMSYCPEHIDCVGLTWRPGDDAATDTVLVSLIDGTPADTYGIKTDLVELADALGGIPICFPEWGPKFEATGASPIADLVVQRTYDFFATISHRLIADCVFDQTVRSLTGFDGSSSAGDAAWRRMVPLRKQLWKGQVTPPTGKPIRDFPSNKHMCLMNQYAFSSGSVFGQFSRVSSLVYRTQNLLQGVVVQLTRASGTHLDRIVDHSAQGMIDHARWHMDYLEDQQDKISGLNNVLWWDLENPNGDEDTIPAQHINVPQSVINAGWQQNTGSLAVWTQYIAAFDPQAPSAFRAEAARWQSGVLAACHDFAAQRRISNFEMGTYNIPGKVSQYTTNPDALSYTTQKNETQTVVFDVDGFSFGGHSMYFSTGGIRTLQQYTDFYAGCVERIRAAYGADHKIIPAVYPRYYLGPSQRHLYPNGSFYIPQNFIAPFINDLLDAGADGFFCWQASGDKDDAAYFNDRWGEVVDDVIIARGTFQKPSA